jgi:hypothetical protein
MAIVHIEKGILKGLDLEEYTAEQLQQLAEPAHATSLTRGAFYRKQLGRVVYRGHAVFRMQFCPVGPLASSVLELRRRDHSLLFGIAK